MEPTLIPLGLAILAGLSTGIGSMAGVGMKKLSRHNLSLILGFSAGIMISVSFVELLFGAVGTIGFGKANLVFFAGMFLMFMIDKFIPHEYMSESSVEEREVMKTGMLTAAGIAIHNFPEGLAVVVAGLSSTKLGVLLAVAIALHNIPEGLAIAAPIFYATNNKKKALKYSLLSGVAEIFGAFAGWFVLMPFINNMLLEALLAFVAGIMVFISLDELIPTAHDCMKRCEPNTGHRIITGIIMGMMVMSFSIWMLK